MSAFKKKIQQLRGGGGAELHRLLYDEFLTDDPAPPVTPRTSEPGPGSLVITDTGASISSGLLDTAGSGEGVFNDKIEYKIDGTALIVRLYPGGAEMIGLFSSKSPSSTEREHCFYLGWNGRYYDRFGYWMDLPKFTFTTAWHWVAIVSMESTVWVIYENLLLFVGMEYNPTYCYWGIADAASYPASIESMQVARLKGPFASPWNLAVYEKRQTVPTGGFIDVTCEADMHFRFYMSTYPSGGTSYFYVSFRRQDSSNFWYFGFHSDRIDLVEVISGVGNVRATTTVLDGYRYYHIVAYANLIQLSKYHPTTANTMETVFNYTSAVNFQEAENIQYGPPVGSGSPGVQTNVAVYNVNLPQEAIDELDRYRS